MKVELKFSLMIIFKNVLKRFKKFDISSIGDKIIKVYEEGIYDR